MLLAAAGGEHLYQNIRLYGMAWHGLKSSTMTKTLPVHPSSPFLSYFCKGKEPKIPHFDVLPLVWFRNSAVSMELYKEKALMDAPSITTCFSFSCRVWKVMHFILLGTLGLPPHNFKSQQVLKTHMKNYHCD